MTAPLLIACEVVEGDLGTTIIDEEVTEVAWDEAVCDETDEDIIDGINVTTTSTTPKGEGVDTTTNQEPPGHPTKGEILKAMIMTRS